jgi:hypothetical protein
MHRTDEGYKDADGVLRQPFTSAPALLQSTLPETDMLHDLRPSGCE